MSEEKDEKTQLEEMKQMIAKNLEFMENQTAECKQDIANTTGRVIGRALMTLGVSYILSVWWGSSWIPSILSIEFIVSVVLIESALHLTQCINSDAIEKALTGTAPFRKAIKESVKDKLLDPKAGEIVTKFEETLNEVKEMPIPFGVLGVLGLIVWIIHLIVRWIAS